MTATPRGVQSAVKMIAALPMYDRAETADANDRLWSNIRAQLGYGPEKLNRSEDVWAIWKSDDLLFAQTCGLPYRLHLHSQVSLIGTPDYGLPDCPAGMYYSVFVTRSDDPRHDISEFSNARFAYNEAMSQSGWAAAQTHARALGFCFENTVKSGAHRDSARLVAEGHADIASIDALSWKMMRDWDDFSAGLKIIARTTPTPTLPFICSRNVDQTKLFPAIKAAISDLSETDRNRLHLKGLVKLPKHDYLAIPTPPAP